MTMLDYTQTSGQGRKLPHSGGQLYCILHTHQIQSLKTIISLAHMKEGLRDKYYSIDEEVKSVVKK